MTKIKIKNQSEKEIVESLERETNKIWAKDPSKAITILPNEETGDAEVISEDIQHEKA